MNHNVMPSTQELMAALQQLNLEGSCIKDFTYSKCLDGSPLILRATIDCTGNNILAALFSRLEAHRIDCLDLAGAIRQAQDRAAELGHVMPKSVAAYLDHAAEIATALARGADSRGAAVAIMPAASFKQRQTIRETLSGKPRRLLRRLLHILAGLAIGSALASLFTSP